MTGLPDPGAAFCLDLVVPGEAEPGRGGRQLAGVDL